MGGLGASSALGKDLVDLSIHMTPGWQQVDLASRCIKKALIATDFQKMNKVVAVLQSVLDTVTELLAAYNTGSKASGSTDAASTSEVPNASIGSPSTSSDADAQPPAADDSGDNAEA